MTKTITEKTN